MFNPRTDQRTQKVFRLLNVQRKFEGKTYAELDDPDRVRLNDSIIHATIVKQDAPAEDDTSVYYIFERLNYGGRRLTPQEIRVALYHGSFVDMIQRLNEHPLWRNMFGRTNSRLKDQELILRYFAFLHSGHRYERPMAEFLNKFVKQHQHAAGAFLGACEQEFDVVCDLLWRTLGAEVFRPERALNAAVLDSVMVGAARRLRSGPVRDDTAFAEAYRALLQNRQYSEAVSRSTADEAFVATRINSATDAFSSVP